MHGRGGVEVAVALVVVVVEAGGGTGGTGGVNSARIACCIFLFVFEKISKNVDAM